MLKQIKTLIIILSVLVLSSCNNKIYYLSTPSIWNNSGWEYQEYNYDDKCEVYTNVDGYQAIVFYDDTLITRIIYYVDHKGAAEYYMYFINSEWKCKDDMCKSKYGNIYFLKENEDSYILDVRSKQ